MAYAETKGSPQKRILLTCLMATLGIHVSAFFYFYTFPPVFSTSWSDFFGKTLPILRMVPKEEENAILEEFFEPLPELSTLFVLPFDMLSSGGAEEKDPVQEAFAAADYNSELQLLTESEQQTLALPGFTTAAFSSEIAEEKDLILFPESPSFSSKQENYEFLNRLSSLPLPIEVEIEEEQTAVFTTITPEPAQVHTRREKPVLPLVAVEPKMHAAIPDKMDPQPSLSPGFTQEAWDWQRAKPTFKETVESIDAYHLPAVHITEFEAENFEADVRIMKARGSKGYLFSVSLKPIKNTSIQKMRHNFTFLIDRSNSVEKHHFASFKKAALRAISMLQPEDTFNIVLFDKKAVSFSETPVPYSKSALSSAEAFLMKQQSGGLFAAADLYAFLFKLIPAYTPEDEVNTLILITDGTTDAPVKKQKVAIQNFLDTNKSRTTLYTAAVARGNDLKLLDLISTSTGGSLLYSETYAAFARKLAGLVYRLRDPVAKELKVTAIVQEQEMAPTLHSASTTLYSGQPFEIVGKIDQLSDFTLLIEGVHEGEPLRIKKKISFEKAKTDSAFVTKLWDAEKTRENHKQFLATEMKPATSTTKPTKKR